MNRNKKEIVFGLSCFLMKINVLKLVMVPAQRRLSSPVRSEAPNRANNQGETLSRSGRNARSAAASGSPFWWQKLPEERML